MNKIGLEVISRVYATLNTTIVLHCLVCLKAKHEVQSPESQYWACLPSPERGGSVHY